jgi:hypothetical protein
MPRKKPRPAARKAAEVAKKRSVTPRRSKMRHAPSRFILQPRREIEFAALVSALNLDK